MAAESWRIDDLRTSWRHLTCTAGWDGSTSSGICEELLLLWSAPSRAYHNSEHLQECLMELDAETVLQPDMNHRAIALAIWFHDAIYDAHRTDNEAASAELAINRLRRLGESSSTIDLIRRLIMDTAHRTDPATPEGELLVDIDLAILGKNPDRFDNYCAGIRLEYAHVPWPDYRVGRSKVLRSFLAKPVIYQTARLRRQYEATARQNLARAIDALDAS